MASGLLCVCYVIAPEKLCAKDELNCFFELNLLVMNKDI